MRKSLSEISPQKLLWMLVGCSFSICNSDLNMAPRESKVLPNNQKSFRLGLKLLYYIRVYWTQYFQFFNYLEVISQPDSSGTYCYLQQQNKKTTFKLRLSHDFAPNFSQDSFE